MLNDAKQRQFNKINLRLNANYIPDFDLSLENTPKNSGR